MRTLGAVIAGGASRRFGSDKAAADLDGKALLERVVAALTPQVEAIALVGHDWPGCETLADRPPGVGPLGGLAAALAFAAERGFGGVLAVPVDVHPLPCDLVPLLAGEGPAVFADQHMIGWWPSALADELDRFIAGGGRAVHDWIDAATARRIDDPPGLVNVNTPDDLARLALGH